MATSTVLQNSIRAANRQIDSLNKQIDDARKQNRALDVKIQQLEAAKQHAEWAGFNADQLKQCLFTVPSGQWAGTNWDRFRDTTHGGSAYTSANDLHHHCDALRDEIQAQINSARSQQNWLADAIGSARDSIASLYVNISNFTNQLSRLDH